MLESLKEAAAIQKRRLGQKLLHSPLHPLYLKLAGSPQVREYRRFAAALGRSAPPPEWFREQMATWTYRPRISILMAARNSKPEWLKEAVDSVLAQIYPEWQLVIVDDASETPLKPPDHSRILFARLESRGGISGALNRALEIADGEYILVLDHDDFLSRDALYRVVEALQRQKYEVLYSDEEYVDENGEPTRPNFKPDWSPELISNCMYVGHLVVATRELIRKIGGFRSEFDGAQDYDLALRLTDEPRTVAHLPYILYHWRQHRESIAQRSDAKPWANDAGLRAVEDMIRRRRWDASASPAQTPTWYQITWNLAQPERASIVCQGQSSGFSIARHTDYGNFEVVASVAEASGAYLVFLEDGLRPEKPDWLARLIAIAQRPEIGAVGAKLIYPNGAIQHSGIALGMTQGFGYPGRGIFQSDYWRWLDYTRNVTAVSGACLVTRRDVFESIGGFDGRLGSELSAIEFCLRVRQSGLEVILEHQACLIATGPPRARFTSEELRNFRERWKTVLAQPDAFYSIYLSRDREDTSLREPTEIALGES